MNIEEKARAYDEALERCKEWASGTWGHSVDDSPKDIAEFIFPQLAESEDESEDERVRKEIISFLRSPFIKENLTDEKVAPWIAYLEKQKEPENTSASTMAPSCWEVEQKEPHFTKRNALFDKCVENCDPEIMKRVSDEVDEMLEKEQKLYWKPTKTDVALLNKAIITNNTLTPTEREQLDIIRSRFGYCRASNCNGIVQEKPNSAECSDDERIREDIVALIKFALNDGSAVSPGSYTTKEEALAYLEKQKKEPLRDFIDNFPYSAKQEEQDWNKKPCLTCQEYEKGHKQGYTEGCTAGYNKAMKERTEEILGLDGNPIYYEQKPAEINLKVLLTADCLASAEMTERLKERSEILENPEKYGLQKSAEWSEEDEGELQNAIDALEFLGKKGVYKSESGYDAALQAASWLKDLPERFNLQSKQEWSEEDKRCFDEAIECLENLNFDGHASNLKILRDFRKPLNTWKPSEEQMKALNALNCHGDLSYVGQQSELISLYNDLKKLM